MITIFVWFKNSPTIINLETIPLFELSLSHRYKECYIRLNVMYPTNAMFDYKIPSSDMGVDKEKWNELARSIARDGETYDRFQRAVREWLIENAKKEGIMPIEEVIRQILDKTGVKLQHEIVYY